MRLMIYLIPALTATIVLHEYILPILALFIAIALPYGIITNLLTPARTRQQHMSKNDYGE